MISFLIHSTMTFRTDNARKRKEMAEKPDVVISSGSDDDKIERKARRVSTNASASTATSPQVDTLVATENATANTASAATEEEDTPAVTEKANTSSTASSTTDNEKSIHRSIGEIIQDLSCSDNVKVNAALAALDLDFMKDKKKCESFVTAGGCFVSVQLMWICFDKACDQVAELNENAELRTLQKTLGVITNLTFHHDASKVGIAATGGVEVIVKIMKTFLKCQALQVAACGTLLNLTSCSIGIGKANAIESGGIEALLAVVNNHLGSELICERVCKGLINIVKGSKKSVGLLISMAGTAAFAKVRTKWPNNDRIQIQVRALANLIAAEIKAW
jgi:hypothetical protein